MRVIPGNVSEESASDTKGLRYPILKSDRGHHLLYRDEARTVALRRQFSNCVLVAYSDHLVEEEVEVDFRHLPDDWQELGKPGVDLLAC